RLSTAGALLIINTILTRDSEKTSRAAQADLFTSDHRERLHPPSHKATVDKQARRNGDSVKSDWRRVKM
ncbi:MAG: hypothetical protein IKA32_06150, partial [Lentisphaeria bacterium]|nr:hypothetical protein [Lentisphaeria bacterium]